MFVYGNYIGEPTVLLAASQSKLADGKVQSFLNDLLPESLSREQSVLIISNDGSKLVLACPENEFSDKDKQRVEYIMSCAIEWKHLPKCEIVNAVKFAFSDEFKEESVGHELLQEFDEQEEYGSGTIIENQ